MELFKNIKKRNGKQNEDNAESILAPMGFAFLALLIIDPYDTLKTFMLFLATSVTFLLLWLLLK